MKIGMSNFFADQDLVVYPPMKIVLFGVFVGFFFVLPMYMLDKFVLPQLNSMKQFYANEGQTVQNMFPQQ